jgi:flagellar basal-body rod protein FlgC
VDGIVQSTTPGTASYDPGNPLADANGYVYSSNVNVVEQMADMISASRSYQNDADVLNTSKQLLLDTLKLGQS